MTLLFCDSFDHYATAQIPLKWLAGSNATIVAAGRNGTKALQIQGSDNYCRMAFPGGAIATAIVGFSLAMGGALATIPIAHFLSAGGIQCTLQLNSASGHIELRRGWNGPILATGAAVIRAGSTNYIEWKAAISTTVGASTVRVNGAVDLTAAAVNTANVGGTTADGFQFTGGGGGDGYIRQHDDFYLCDTNGAVNNDFLGDVRICALLPAGPGTYTEWDGLTGAATHWQAVNQATPDDDTSYVSDTLAIPGHRDTYAMASLPAGLSGTVPGVQVVTYARKDDAGVRTIAALVRSGGADAQGASANMGTTYAYRVSVFEADPGAAAWSVAKVNAIEVGPKAVA
jgi:hypothetical protein